MQAAVSSAGVNLSVTDTGQVDSRSVVDDDKMDMRTPKNKFECFRKTCHPQLTIQVLVEERRERRSSVKAPFLFQLHTTSVSLLT